MNRMMEFAIKKISDGARLATIRGAQPATESIEMPTPNCTLYTRIGSVPHVTKDMLAKIDNLPAIVQYSLTQMAEHHETIAKYGKGIKQFTVMQGFLSYITIQDTSAPIQSGYNDKLGTSVWGRGGKIKIDDDMFLKIQEAFQADIYQSLCDSDTPPNSSRKRIRKSVERSLSFLEKIMKNRSKNEKIKQCSIIGTLEGGRELADRLHSAQETAAHPVSGFCVEGLHLFGPEMEKMEFEEVQELVQKSMSKLPDDKPRFLPGVWSPINILKAVAAGIDVFESVYPYIVTERGCASMFNYDINKKGAIEENTENKTEQQSTDYVMEIGLKDKCYVDDFGPLVAGCECYTCKTFSRAYVNHLLNTTELLAGTLLMMHNLHHYLGFFKAIREAIEQDKLQELTTLIQHQTIAR